MHAAAEDLGIKMETKGEPPGLRTRGEVVVTVYEELPPFRRRPPERGCSRSRVPKPAPPRGGDRRAALLAYSQQLRKTNGEQDQMAQEKGNWRTQQIWGTWGSTSRWRLPSWIRRLLGQHRRWGDGRYPPEEDEEEEELLPQRRPSYCCRVSLLFLAPSRPGHCCSTQRLGFLYQVSFPATPLADSCLSFGGCRRRLKTLLDRFPRVWRICGNLKCWRKNHHGDICQRRARIKTDTIKEPQ
ncbi:unnamed protein product [Spirodela intermedia]|uniref:Uncharacterized protein n=1 Tax=Spirodela intermedia TaxID=51605 RepID=A0A7I8J3W7_SPIIN|nr:unnamed protein product [Spirodela intermedia]CAA6664917.1 unnamed protein product [Spirodela intermedia]